MAEAAASEAEAKKPKGKKGLMIIGMAALLLLGGGGAGAFVLMRGGGETKGKTKSAKAEEGGEHAKSGKGEKGGEAGESGVLSLESFIANLADAEGDRYIKCTMRLELDDKASADALKSNELAITKIRDRILTLLTSKTYAQIASAEGKDTLRSEIRAQLDPLLGGCHIAGVYYTEFIVQ